MNDATTIATAVVETRGLIRDFQVGARTVHALRGIDLRIEPGEFVALRGRSGFRQDYTTQHHRRTRRSDTGHVSTLDRHDAAE